MTGNARSLALLTSVALACSARNVDTSVFADASVDRGVTPTDVPAGSDVPVGVDTPAVTMDVPPGSDVQPAVDVPLAGASQQIAAVRASAPGPVALRVEGAVVTYVVASTVRMDGTVSPTDPGGFFVQADRTGPALFVAVNASTLTPAPAVGDRVSFTVTRVSTPTSPSSRWAAEVGGYSRTATGVPLGAMVQDVSGAADLVTNLQGYEHELITVTGTLTSDFVPGGTGFVQAALATAALPADTMLRLRIPTSLQGPLGLRMGCRLTVAATPLWRFDVTAQPSAWTSRDVLDTSCPPPGMDAGVDVPSTPVDTGVDVPVDRGNPVTDTGTPTGDDRVWVVRVGDGVIPLTGAAFPVNIEAYNGATGASLGPPIGLPTVTSGANLALTLSGTAGAEGSLFRSVDGRYAVLGGYETAPGTPSGIMALGQRVIARINAAGVVDSRTGVGAVASGMTIRAVATVDGSSFWSIHSQTSVGDVVYTGYGGSPAGVAVTNREVFRGLSLFGQQLLAAGSNSGGSGVYATPTLPRAPGGSIALLPGFPPAMTLSPYGMAIFDRDGNGAPDVIFFADDRSLIGDGGVPGGGLLCWRLIGGTWTSMGNVTGLPNPLRGLTGRTNGSDYVFYGVTSEGRARLLRIDVSASTLSGVVTVLAQAPANMTYRGVAFAPR